MKDPRFLQNQKQQQGVIEIFKFYVSKKISYKSLRIKLIRENKNKMKKFKFIEEIYPFFILNSIFFSYLTFKKQPMIVKFCGAIAMCTFSYFCISFYGEEKLYNQEAIQNSDLGFYLRQQVIVNLPELYSVQKYKQIDDNYGLVQFSKEYQSQIIKQISNF